MNSILSRLSASGFAVGLCLFGFFATGCLVGSVGTSGGIGATTVTNSNPSAILAAANEAFAQEGYAPGPVDFPDSASYDKSAGAFGQALYGSYGESTSFRAKLTIVPLPETNNFRIAVKVSRVNNAGEAGFEDSVPMLGIWSTEFTPILRAIRVKASGAGPY